MVFGVFSGIMACCWFGSQFGRLGWGCLLVQSRRRLAGDLIAVAVQASKAKIAVKRRYIMAVRDAILVLVEDL